jgi:hypothetical protein
MDFDVLFPRMLLLRVVTKPFTARLLHHEPPMKIQFAPGDQIFLTTSEEGPVEFIRGAAWCERSPDKFIAVLETILENTREEPCRHNETEPISPFERRCLRCGHIYTSAGEAIGGPTAHPHEQ